jgi:hypothetical protein
VRTILSFLCHLGLFISRLVDFRSQVSEFKEGHIQVLMIFSTKAYTKIWLVKSPYMWLMSCILIVFTGHDINYLAVSGILSVGHHSE